MSSSSKNIISFTLSRVSSLVRTSRTCVIFNKSEVKLLILIDTHVVIDLIGDSPELSKNMQPLYQMSFVQGINSVPTELMCPFLWVRNVLRRSMKNFAFDVALLTAATTLIHRSVYDHGFPGVDKNSGFCGNCL